MKSIYILIILTISLFGKEYTLKNNFNSDKILSSKEWNQLLYYSNNKSEVNDKSFFLSSNGNSNPKEELLATLDSYSSVDVNDSSPICQFPARYMFLSNYVNFKDYKLINPECSKLNKWEGLNNTDSISLILVSGYVSNPASTFGHSFIKLNNSENTDLFSSSINYGALVPENENMLAYISKGLTGFYHAGFSDQYFYNQDLAYTDTEFRDIWDYNLNLTEDEKTFILLHIWEIVGKKYDYYFLNKNCGFRVSQVLNLVTKSDIINENSLWFLPVETFQSIEKNEPQLINEVKFIPSNKKVFNEYFNRLTSEQKDVVKNLLLNNFENKNMLNSLNEEDKITVLDFLIFYYKQSLIINEGDMKIAKLKQNVLVERFKYKTRKLDSVIVKEVDSPAKNTNPINVELSAGYDSVSKEYLGLSFSPFKQTSLGISNLGFDNLVTLDTRVGVKQNKIFLDKFDFMKIDKVNLDKNNLLEEFKYNWSLHIGIDRFNDRVTHFASLGVGYNIYDNENFIVYSFLKSSLNDSSYLSVIPGVGFEYKYDRATLKIEQEMDYTLFKGEDKKITNLILQYNFNQDYNIGYELKVIDSEYKNIINFKLKF